MAKKFDSDQLWVALILGLVFCVWLHIGCGSCKTRNAGHFPTAVSISSAMRFAADWGSLAFRIGLPMTI